MTIHYDAIINYFHKWTPINDVFHEECYRLLESFKGERWLGHGRHRAAFLSNGGNVIKVPMCGNGVSDNAFEAAEFKRNPKYKARCRRAGLLLVMEFVKQHSCLAYDLPKWTHYIDCQQVGYNSKGTLVAYDYA